MPNELKLISSEKNPFKKIVILGAGPIGLFIAILLKQRGIDAVVCDSRAGVYTRSGGVEHEVFETLGQLLGFGMIPHDESHHIKVIERFLYSKAQSLGIQFRKENFSRIQGKQVEFKNDESKEKSSIPCDILIDCTGSARVVINHVNAMGDLPFFTIKTLEQPPRSPYCLVRAHANFDFDQYQENRKEIYNNNSFLVHYKKMRQMGWRYDGMPYSHVNEQTKDKYNFYSEIPKTLHDEDLLLEWIRIQIQLRCNDNNPQLRLVKNSSKFPRKQRASKFEIESKLVTPLYYSSDEHPLIFHAGDATATMNPYTGKGLILGAQRAYALIHSFRVQSGNITEIDVQSYQTQFDEIMQDYRESLVNLGSEMATYINDEKNNLKALFSRAAKSFKEIEDKNTGIAINKFNAKTTFDDCIIAFVHLDLLLDLNARNELLATAYSVAQACKKLGSHFFKQSKLALAKKYYQHALEIFEANFPDAHQYADDKIAVCSNLIIVAQKIQDHKGVIELADLVLNKIIPHVTEGAEKEKFIAKITFASTKALLSQLEKFNLSDAQDIARISPLIMQLNNMIALLRDNAFSKGAGVNEFCQQLKSFENRCRDRKIHCAGFDMDPSETRGNLKPGTRIKFY